MIRLTLHQHTEPEVHLFNKSEIVISSESVGADLFLTVPHIAHINLKIIMQNGSYFLFNVLNDPFISLNGYPFGKKLLHSGDLIRVGDMEILYEVLEAISSKSEETPKEGVKESTLTKSQSNQNSQLGFELPFEEEVQILKDEELSDKDIENYVKILNIPKNSKSQLSNKLSEQKNKARKTSSLKDDYLKDLDDDGTNRPYAVDPTEPSHLYQVWKYIIIFIVSVISLGAIVGVIAYFNVSDRTEAQNIKVAQSMADIAMALTHAQLHHLRPHNQNWSDIDFLKENIRSILPYKPSYFLGIDSQGQFSFSPYSLRIYTSKDLGRFLLIAQPAPSVLQWLIPKSVILIDSTAMELRMIKDVRYLNRLLANSEPLDGINGKEISAVIKQGELIPLTALADGVEQRDFAPPMALGDDTINENLIYNAPRYFYLGKSLIDRGFALSQGKGTGHEVALLKQSIEALSKFDQLILYSDRSWEDSLKAQKSIVTFAPKHHLKIGYVAFDSQGKISDVQLLANQLEEKEDIALNDDSEENLETKLNRDPSQYHLTNIDRNHPIYILLSQLTEARKHALTPLMLQIQDRIKQETQIPKMDFDHSFKELVSQYFEINSKYKASIRAAFQELTQQYDGMPSADFMNLANAAGIGVLADIENFNSGSNDRIEKNTLESTIQGIHAAKNWNELNQAVEEANGWLAFEHFSDTSHLIEYQNQVRNAILIKLEKWLLTEDKDKVTGSGMDNISEQQKMLEQILSNTKFVTPEEREFFLSEYSLQ